MLLLMPKRKKRRRKKKRASTHSFIDSLIYFNFGIWLGPCFHFFPPSFLNYPGIGKLPEQFRPAEQSEVRPLGAK